MFTPSAFSNSSGSRNASLPTFRTQRHWYLLSPDHRPPYGGHPPPSIGCAPNSKGVQRALSGLQTRQRNRLGEGQPAANPRTSTTATPPSTPLAAGPLPNGAAPHELPSTIDTERKEFIHHIDRLSHVQTLVKKRPEHSISTMDTSYPQIKDVHTAVRSSHG
ncbi:unnamed protein product [Ectocarpus sp. 13 AM-2016]